MVYYFHIREKIQLPANPIQAVTALLALRQFRAVVVSKIFSVVPSCIFYLVFYILHVPALLHLLQSTFYTAIFA